MPLQEFAFPDGSINPLALLEQQTGVQCVTVNDAVSIAALLANSGGGTVLNLLYQPTSWPCSWCLARQGNDLILWFAGTANVTQWAGDVLGVFAVDYHASGAKAHSFFLLASISLWAAIQPFLPSDVATCRVKIAGTSYGGAVAFLIALEWLRSYPGADIQLFQNAAPKALTQGYAGPLPIVNFVVKNAGDVFPLAPPNGLLSSVVAVAPSVNFAVPINWTHYGKGVSVNLAGVFREVSIGEFNSPITASGLATTYTDHYLTSYQLASVQQVQSYTNTPYSVSVTTLALQLISEAPTQTTVTNAGALASVDLSQQNVEVFAGTPTFPLNQTNLVTVQSGTVGIVGVTNGNSIFTRAMGINAMALKITFFYSVNLAGFSESWYLPAGSNPSAYPVATAVDYLSGRLYISGSQTQIQWVRVSTVGSPRNVAIYTQDDLTKNGLSSLFGRWVEPRTHNPAASDFGGTSLLVRKVAGPQFSRWFLRGVPDFMIQNGGTYVPTSPYRIAINNFFAKIITQGLTWKAVSGQQPGSPALITAGVQNTDGTATFTLGAPVFNALLVPANQNVAVTIRGQVTPAYINGPLTVRITSATTCQTLRPLPVVGLVPNSGKMRVNIAAGYPTIVTMEVEKVVKRGPGRPFGLYRGRAKNRLVA